MKWAAKGMVLWISVAFAEGLYLWQAGKLTAARGVGGSSPLAHALRDADTLLEKARLRDTVELEQVAGLAGYVLLQQADRCLLQSADTLGWVYGLYALLSEKHGFAFLHPKETLRVPKAHLPPWRKLEGRARFRWRGFHLHTQHPIELTEALHDPAFPDGENLVRAYIDWLVRNGQNYFEFCLLRSVDWAQWVPYFARIVAYARERGLTVGVDLSLRMQQQRAFQLLPRYTFSKRRYMRKKLEALAAIGVERLNVELTSAEFVGKDWGRWIDTLLRVAKPLGLQLTTRQHVPPPEGYAVGQFSASTLPPEFTLCVHSVMCYGLRDTFTPVYRCTDFSHLQKSIETERKYRAVWYYPETAYWVSFDNSVPVWLLSYLRSRWEDIQAVEGQVEGHLTFSSGWDVGYWLFDWSVAGWAWQLRYDGTLPRSSPADKLVRLYGGDTLSWERLIRFQDSVLVGRNGLSWITPTTPIDELGWGWLPPFQPRLPAPPWKVYRRPHRYRSAWMPYVEGLGQALARWPAWPTQTLPELLAAWELTRLRVQFRYYWLRGLLAERGSASEAAALDSLQHVLWQAERWVSRLPVRYPHTAQRRIRQARGKGCPHPHPSYRFGYLYPALKLHFWRRELGQLEGGRWSLLYQNLWDIPRIVGLW